MGEGGRSRLLDELEGLLRSVQENSFTPVMLEKEGHPSDFTFQPISQYGPAVSCVPFPSFSALLDRFYEQRENQERVRQRGQDLIRSVTNARDRAARRIGFGAGAGRHPDRERAAPVRGHHHLQSPCHGEGDVPADGSRLL